MTLHQLEAQKMARRIQSGELTAEAVLRSCLEKIEAREEVIGAWEHLDSRQALEQAQNLDRKTYRGLLHGVPVGAKDIFDTSDMPTEYGSAIYSGHRPVWDAASIAALRAAGAMILGKTVTTEFAIFHPGKTVNPKAPAHTPGGSSSGSAAAVADDMVPLALGTQTAGSIIRPASYCGVVGYKPTFGLIHRAGVKSISESLDTVGTLTRSVADAALLTTVLAGRPHLHPVAALGLIHRAGVKSISESLDTVGTLTRSVADAALLTTVLAGRPHLHPVAALAQPPRIGLCRTPQWDFAEEATTQAFAQASELVRQAGATVVDTSLPNEFDGLATAQAEIMAYEASRGLAFERHTHGDQLSESLSALLAEGAAITPDRYDEALRLAHRCRTTLDEVFQDRDVLLAPSATGEAPEGLDSTGDPIFCRIWTLLHVPCINLPGLKGPGGLPVGIQLVGKVGRDAELLAVARWMEGHMRSVS